MNLMDFAAAVALAIGAQGGRVTKLIVDEPEDDSEYANCYHVRVEDGVRWAEYWVSRTTLTDRQYPLPTEHVAKYLLFRLAHGEALKAHKPARLTQP